MQTTTPDHAQQQAALPWYRHPWPWLLMLGPFMVILGGVYTLWLALSQPDAMVADDYYKEGKAINQDLRRDRKAAELGLHASLRYDPAAEKLRGDITGKIAPDTSMQLLLIHSTQPAKDIKLALHPDSAGRFALDLPALDKANWRIQIEDERATWRLTGEWLWPARQAVELTSE
ncbi:MAG: FixH family protein [Proteobacteria bacterium]|nr:FixH family protein [Pseudomonadota bacterium]